MEKQDLSFKGKMKSFMDKNSSLVTLLGASVALIIVGWLAHPAFMTFGNWSAIITSMVAVGTMGAGLTISMLLGGLDVSQYSILAFAAMFFGVIISPKYWGMSFTVACLGALAVGTIGGLLNAFLVCKLRIIPVIATTGTQFIWRGFSYIITNNDLISLLKVNDAVTFVSKGKILNLPFTFYIMIASFVFVWFVLKYTTFGRRVFAVGANIRAAYLSGIKVNVVRTEAYLFGGVFAGIGAIMTVCLLASALPSTGTGLQMDVSAGVILGGLSIAGGKGSVVGTFFGILFLQILANIFTLTNINSYWQMVVKGIVLVTAIWLDVLRGGRGYQ